MLNPSQCANPWPYGDAARAYCDGYQRRSTTTCARWVDNFDSYMEGYKQRNREEANLPSKPPAPSATTPPRQHSAVRSAYPLLKPNSPLGQGMALYLKDELQQALLVLIAATQTNPKNARRFTHLAATYYKLGMHREF